MDATVVVVLAAATCFVFTTALVFGVWAICVAIQEEGERE